MESQIKEDLKQAQLDRDEIRVSTLRMLSSELTYAKVAKGLKNSEEQLSDEEVLPVIKKEAKKRKEAFESFKNAGRTESADKEAAELKILEGYLPEEMGDEELTKIVEESITNIGASTMADMGKVIGIVMGKVNGQADGSRISRLVKERLS